MLTRSRHRFALLDRRANREKAPLPAEGTPRAEMRFDDFARTLATTTSRRQTVGALLGGALGLHGLADVAAKKNGGKKPWCHCPNDNPDNCVTLKLDKKARKKHKKNHPLDHAGECQPQDLSCPPGQTVCNEVCKDLQTDQNHCGACNNSCGASGTCCSGVCKNLNTDETNCGACGNPCGAGQICCSGVCKNLNNDENNCGTCGNACGGGQTCCSGVCKNLNADPANCGTCGNICVAPQVLCLAGDCCKPPALPCAIPGADATCCTGVCLPANMGIPFPHCA